MKKGIPKGFPFFDKELGLNTTKCPQCGFRAELRTETNFHTCRQCGTLFRVVVGQSVSEQYFRHENNDARAWGVLLVQLDSNAASIPVRPISLVFGYHPFWYADFADGSTCFVAAGTTLEAYPIPSVPPPGDLEFIPTDIHFPKADNAPQTIVSGDVALSRLRLLQLPLYLISFELSGQQCQATVSGCSWQVSLMNIPEETTIQIPASRIQFMAVYLILLLLVGTLSVNFYWRSGLIAIVLSSAWLFERSSGRVQEEEVEGGWQR